MSEINRTQIGGIHDGIVVSTGYGRTCIEDHDRRGENLTQYTHHHNLVDGIRNHDIAVEEIRWMLSELNEEIPKDNTDAKVERGFIFQLPDDIKIPSQRDYDAVLKRLERLEELA